MEIDGVPGLDLYRGVSKVVRLGIVSTIERAKKRAYKYLSSFFYLPSITIWPK